MPRANDLSYTKLRAWMIDRVAKALQSNGASGDPETAARRYAEMALQHTGVEMPPTKREGLIADVINHVIGFGPLQPLLDDESITEIMVNGDGKVYVEKSGRIEKTALLLDDPDLVLNLIRRMVAPLGRRLDERHPTVDARLPDGSRVNAAIPPVAIDGPTLTIRKFSKQRLGMKDLIRLGSISAHMAEFLRACVVSRLNIVVSGGTGSGKTTLLNILSSFIPENQRIITIEDSAELQLQQEHVVRLEANPGDPDGEGEVTIRHLVRNAMRMRPDRIIVGEVRGGEALDMLQAMNTGHDGSLTTVHANSPRDALARLETLTMFAGFDLPLRVIREQIASAVDLIVQVARTSDGSRKVISICEISGMEGETIVMSELFKFEERGLSTKGRLMGEFTATGIRPMFEPHLIQAGFRLPPEVFGLDKMRIGR
jgi:pilus assembly protein CpaF